MAIQHFTFKLITHIEEMYNGLKNKNIFLIFTFLGKKGIFFSELNFSYEYSLNILYIMLYTEFMFNENIIYIIGSGFNLVNIYI